MADLRNLCKRPETISKAKQLINLAKPKTGPGSGFDLHGLATHLPVFCAFIASESLQNNDLDFKTAQVAACIRTADFTKGVETVKKALAGHTPRATRASTRSNFQGLLDEYNLSNHEKRLNDAMKLVENKFVMLLEIPDTQRKYITVAIFFWVCSILEVGDIDLDELVVTQNVNATSCKDIVLRLRKKGGSLAAQIKADLNAPNTPSPSRPSSVRTPTRASPTKATRQPPMKQSPLKTLTAALGTTTPTKPAASLHTRSQSPIKRVPPTGSKRKAPEPQTEEELDDEDDELLLQRSPSKKQKNDKVKLVVPSFDAGVDETPSKKRTTKPTFGVARIPGVFGTPTRKHITTARPASLSVAKRLFTTPTRKPPGRAVTQDSPVRRKTVVVEEETSDSEDELEQVQRPRRFRPVFLEMRQWKMIDPRLTSVWKQAEERKSRLVAKYGSPFATMQG